MSISIDEATAVGFAVSGYLSRPDLGPGDPGALPPVPARIAALARTVEHLQAVGLVSEAQRQVVSDFLLVGAAVEAPTGSDPRSVGAVLIATAQRYPADTGPVADVYAALAAVADAAVEGHAHGGPWAALCCAAAAAVPVLTQAHKQDAHKQDAHKEDAHKEDDAHKQGGDPFVIPAAHKE